MKINNTLYEHRVGAILEEYETNFWPLITHRKDQGQLASKIKLNTLVNNNLMSISQETESYADKTKVPCSAKPCVKVERKPAENENIKDENDVHVKKEKCQQEKVGLFMY